MSTHPIDQEYAIYDSLSDSALEALYDVYIETTQIRRLTRLARVISYRVSESLQGERFGTIESHGSYN